MNSQYDIFFDLLTYLVVVFDFGITFMKFSEKAIIEPKHLNIYPLSKWQRFIFDFILLLTDYKSFLYFSALIISILFVLRKNSFLCVLITFFVWLLLLTNVITWTVVGFRLGERFIFRNQEHTQLISSFLFVFPLLVMNLLDVNLVKYIPLTSYVANSIYGLFILDYTLIINNIILLIAILGLGISVYAFITTNS